MNPVTAALLAMPAWILTCRDFDSIEVQPCRRIYSPNGVPLSDTCDPAAAQFWTVYGWYRQGGSEPLEEFPTEAEARWFAEQVRRICPHLRPVAR
jgi:hypothetical protein